MPSGNKNNSSRVAFLADRMAILMAICIVQNGGKLTPWFKDSLYEGETGDEFRSMQEYSISLQIVRNMLKREIARSAPDDHKSANP